ncbi:hypothetical protein [Streptomyces sp. PRh5]|uniref:hypothetical protein n=1 Tax=Streptomyces sp. PRh5 TaxID=1158056 RepID=UPI0004ACFD26|nr:hypothetical protein [Streptomyces sp. PRh5]
MADFLRPAEAAHLRCGLSGPALPALPPYAPGRGTRPYDSGPSRQRIGNARPALRHPGGIAVRSLAHLA